ncbi:MAG: low molecular weight protein arginine phosphatase [Bacilli bacterium]
MRLLFVCTGNTCRSPMAQYIAQHLAPEHWHVASRGVYAINGGAASGGAKRTLEGNGYSVSHESRVLSQTDIEEADLVLTMTAAHKAAIAAEYGSFSHVHTLAEYSGLDTGDIADPYGGDDALYAATYASLVPHIAAVIGKQIKAKD